MAWTFDLPSALPITGWPNEAPLVEFDHTRNPSNLKVAYDGKNLWYVNKWRTHVVVVDFWGPFNFALDDLPDLNGFYNRHLCPEDDLIRAFDRGQQIRVLAVIEIFKLLPGQDQLNSPAPSPVIQSITYLNNEVHVVTLDGKGYRFPCDLSIRTIEDLPTNKTYTINGENDSDVVGLSTKIFTVGPAPIPQPFVDDFEPDSQSLIWYDTTTNTNGSTVIPGRKQLTPRRLAVANDCVYVTAYNELNVYKFDVNGSLLATIPVNRDVENIFADGSDVWVISSNKGALTFPATEPDGDARDLSSFMISKIDASNNVTNVVGFPNFGAAGGNSNIHLANSGDHLWLLGKDGQYARIALSNLRAILSDRNVVEGDDFNFSTVQPSMVGEPIFTVSGTQVTLTGVKTTFQALDLATRLVNLWVSPPHTYQWFDGASFQTVNIPKFLVLFQEAEGAGQRPMILIQRLPAAIKYDSNMKINNYVAISSGARRYKGD